jgi:hypothetical protein
VQLGLPLLVGAALLVGLLVCGALLREQLRQEGVSSIDFTDIECDPPPGVERQDLLLEARYLAEVPARISLLEPGANETIARALATHPWVAEVKRVEQVPPGRVRVRLVYRVAVLAVAKPPLTVDRHGVLLPQAARREGLPVLHARVAPPRGGPGAAWGDATVKAAAAVAGLLHPHTQALKLAGCRVEVEAGDLVLTTATARILWGQPPGSERPDEVTAEQKVQRLLARPALEGHQHDLRPASGVVRRAWRR